MSALLQPGPKFAILLDHPMLNINLFDLVAREGDIEPVEMTGFDPRGDLLFVKEIRGSLLAAEEQPIPARGAHCLPFFKECAKWCDAGAWADHDYGRITILRQFETV